MSQKECQRFLLLDYVVKGDDPCLRKALSNERDDRRDRGKNARPSVLAAAKHCAHKTPVAVAGGHGG